MLPCNFREISFVEETPCYNYKPVIKRCYEPVVPTYCAPKPVCRPVVVRKPVYVNSCGAPVKRCVTVKKPCACKKSLLNKDGSFFVNISQAHPYIQILINKARALGLTVSGDGTDCVVGEDITYASEGNFISFGSSSRFDMNWIRRSNYICKKGYHPVYDMVHDWGTILKALEEFAAAKRNNVRITTGGDKVVAHANFTVVNGVVKNNAFGKVNVRMPVRTLTNITHKRNILDLAILNYPIF